MPLTHDFARLSEAYLKTWERHDLEAMSGYLDQDFHFREPLTEITGRQAFLEFAGKNVRYVQHVRILSKLESEGEAVLIYDFVFVEPIGPQKTAAHFVFREGKIRSIELFYDPRHLERMFSAARATSLRS
jgi:ketosteroid isomerase-like protein